jgi:hypothetical protein
MEPLDRILQRVAHTLHMEDKAGEFALFQVWHTILPQRFQGKTRPVRIYYKGRHSGLEVAVDSPVAAQELGFEREYLLDALNRYSLETGIRLKEITLRAR